MAYNLDFECIAFQWKGEKTTDMVHFETMFEGMSFSQTKDKILRLKNRDLCFEAPLGSYVVTPERNLSNVFSLEYPVFRQSCEVLGGLQYGIKLENMDVIFYPDIDEEELKGVLYKVDPHSVIELDKSRLFCSGRYISLTSGHVLWIGQDTVFSLEDGFCRTLAKQKNIVFRDKRVVVDDASVVLIKTDAVVIVDSQRKCSIWKKNLSNGDTDFHADFSANEFFTKMNSSQYQFSVSDNDKANSLSLKFIKDHANEIGIELTVENQLTLLKYILQALSTLVNKGDLSSQRRIVTHLRINQFSFDAVYTQDQKMITLFPAKKK